MRYNINTEVSPAKQWHRAAVAKLEKRGYTDAVSIAIETYNMMHDPKYVERYKNPITDIVAEKPEDHDPKNHDKFLALCKIITED